MVAPYFDAFNLRPVPSQPELISLEWTQTSNDYPFGAHQISDGTLRFICLATALLQPDPPGIMLFDEPELGLHPGALVVLAELLQSASRISQIIVSTQSPSLIDHFDISNVQPVEFHAGQTTLPRLHSKDFQDWLQEYTVGELWEKNIIGGGLHYD